MLARNLAAAEKEQVVRLFYSYAHLDQALRRSFDEVLGRFRWDVAVTPWSDESIQPGDPWENEINKALYCDETQDASAEYERIMAIDYCLLDVECEPLSRELRGWRVAAHDPETAAFAQAAYTRHVLPIIRKEVNEGVTFARNRQFFHAIVAAEWFKKHYREHPMWGRYIDSQRPGVLPEEQYGKGVLAGVRRVSLTVPNASAQEQRERLDWLEACRRNLERSRASQGAAARETVRAAVALARALRDADLRIEASTAWQDAFDAGMACPEVVEGSGLEALYELAVDAQAAGDLPRAEQALQRALTLLDADGSQRDSLRLDVLEELHKVLTAEHRTDEARIAWGKIHTWRTEHRTLGIPENREYHRKYMQVFEHGVFYCQRDELDASTQRKVLRTYVAGAIDFRDIASHVVYETPSSADKNRLKKARSPATRSRAREP